GTRPIIDLYEKYFRDPETDAAQPLYKELSERKAWANIYLLLGLAGQKDRSSISGGVAFVADPSSDLNGESIKDLLSDLTVSGGLEKTLPLARA
ncbi:hypothetical protein, partial [Klebsiella pneumoniae]|uniref:hypothetical protein n=1 Tax=Klebsiella pneumoniae TaxID=573 RepID=UPI0030132CB9